MRLHTKPFLTLAIIGLELSSLTCAKYTTSPIPVQQSAVINRPNIDNVIANLSSADLRVVDKIRDGSMTDIELRGRANEYNLTVFVHYEKNKPEYKFELGDSTRIYGGTPFVNVNQQDQQGYTWKHLEELPSNVQTYVSQIVAEDK